MLLAPQQSLCIRAELNIQEYCRTIPQLLPQVSQGRAIGCIAALIPSFDDFGCSFILNEVLAFSSMTASIQSKAGLSDIRRRICVPNAQLRLLYIFGVIYFLGVRVTALKEK